MYGVIHQRHSGQMREGVIQYGGLWTQGRGGSSGIDINRMLHKHKIFRSKLQIIWHFDDTPPSPPVYERPDRIARKLPKKIYNLCFKHLRTIWTSVTGWVSSKRTTVDKGRASHFLVGCLSWMISNGKQSLCSLMTSDYKMDVAVEFPSNWKSHEISVKSLWDVKRHLVIWQMYLFPLAVCSSWRQLLIMLIHSSSRW